MTRALLLVWFGYSVTSVLAYAFFDLTLWTPIGKGDVGRGLLVIFILGYGIIGAPMILALTKKEKT